MADRAVHGDVLNIARAIAGEGADDAVFREAVIIVQAELELSRARQARLAAITAAMNAADNRGSLAMVTDGAAPTAAVDTGDAQIAEAYRRALPGLLQIHRYERRAYCVERRPSRASTICVCLPS